MKLWVAQVIQDLYEECGKYGQLVSVIVPRPPNPAAAMELFGSNNYGKVGYLHISLLRMSYILRMGSL